MNKTTAWILIAAVILAIYVVYQGTKTKSDLEQINQTAQRSYINKRLTVKK